MFTSDERDIDSLLAGEYFLTVTDTLGCTDTLTVILEQPDELEYNIEGLKDVQCYGPEEGYMKLVAEGGHGSYSYVWSGAVASSSDSITGLVLGKYLYEISDVMGCSVNDSLSLSESDQVAITIDSVKMNPCLGQQVAAIYVSAAGGAGPFTYSWTGPGGFTSVLEDIENLKEGYYNLEIEDARGCFYNHDTSLVDDDPISLEYTVSQFAAYNTLCYGDSSGSIYVDTVAGNGLDWKNFTYIWTGPGGTKTYEYFISDVPAGSYHLNVFDSLDCRSDVTISLTAPPAISIQYDSITDNPCLDSGDGGIYISISGGDAPFTYSWSGPASFTSSEKDIEGLAKGTYSLVVADSNGCSATTETTLVLVDEITMTIETSTFGSYNLLCNGTGGGYIKVNSVTGYGDINDFFFQITGPDGFSSNIRFMYELRAGDYHLSVTDSLGCMGESDVTLTEPPRIETGEISGNDTYIEDTNYTYVVQDTSSGSTYAWNVYGGEIWSGNGSTSVEVEWHAADSGLLTVLETDLNGCEGDSASFKTMAYAPVDTSSTEIPAFLSRSVKIYPVPANEMIFIEGLETVSGSLEIYSLTGTLVLREKIQNRLEISALDPGIYYLRAREQGGNILLTRRIIKH